MLFVILVCLNICLLLLEETLVGDHYFFQVAAYPLHNSQLRFRVQQVSIYFVALNLSFCFLPFVSKTLYAPLDIYPAHTQKESIQYYRKREMCGGQH